MSLSKETKSISRLQLALFAKNEVGITPLSAGFYATCLTKLCSELSMPLEDVNTTEIRVFANNAKQFYQNSSKIV